MVLSIHIPGSSEGSATSQIDAEQLRSVLSVVSRLL